MTAYLDRTLSTLDRIRAMKWPDLVKSARETYDLIYGRNPIYGTRDMVYLDMLEREIYRREEINGCEHEFTYREK
jgi:hypothetical protein